MANNPFSSAVDAPKPDPNMGRLAGVVEGLANEAATIRRAQLAWQKQFDDARIGKVMPVVDQQLGLGLGSLDRSRASLYSSAYADTLRDGMDQRAGTEDAVPRLRLFLHSLQVIGRDVLTQARADANDPTDLVCGFLFYPSAHPREGRHANRRGFAGVRPVGLDVAVQLDSSDSPPPVCRARRTSPGRDIRLPRPGIEAPRAGPRADAAHPLPDAAPPLSARWRVRDG